MAHKGHPKCVYTSKAKCEAADREKLGRCRQLTKDGEDCQKWATDESGLCAQHFEMVTNQAIELRKTAGRKAEMDARIDAYMKATGQEPHECGARCPLSGVAGPPAVA